MHTAKRRGFMETPQGVPLTDDQTSRLAGTSKGDLIRCKEELLLNGVPSIEEETGVMYCRRMVKDTQKAEKCSAKGKSGGGNPNWKKNKENIINKIPEARSHISLKVTFKGQFNGISGDNRDMIEEVLNCVPEFGRLDPASLLKAIHDAGENPRIKENHDEFVRDMRNSRKLPNIPAKKYAAYLQSDGMPNKKKSQKPQTTFVGRTAGEDS